MFEERKKPVTASCGLTNLLKFCDTIFRDKRSHTLRFASFNGILQVSFFSIDLCFSDFSLICNIEFFYYAIWYAIEKRAE